MLVAIDTNVLIWGIRQQGSEEKIKRAGWLIRELEEDDDVQIIVPTIALAEYLRPYPMYEQRTEIIAEFEKRFLLVPFDVRCASFAATFFKKGLEQRPKGNDGSRNQLNADSMIIATAAAAGTEKIFSGDEAFRKLAEHHNRWHVCDLPVQPPDLFGEMS